MDTTDKNIAQIMLEERYSKTKVWANLRAFLMNRFANSTEALQKAADEVEKYITLRNDYYPAKQRRIGFLMTWLDENEEEGMLDIIFTVLIPILRAGAPNKSKRHTGLVPYQVPTLALMHLIHKPEWQARSTRKGMEDQFTYFTEMEATTMAAELVTVICESDLYDVWAADCNPTQSLACTSNVELDQEEIDYLHNVQYMIPMITKPLEVTKNNHGSGYITIEDSVILGKLNRHDEPLGLDALNILNSIELSLDERIMEFPETSSKPLDTPKKVKAFEMWKMSSQQAYEEILRFGNSFYLTNKFDMRGRVNSQGYQINIQSMEYKKAMINLKRKEVIV